MKDYMKIQKSRVKSGGGGDKSRSTHTHTNTHTQHTHTHAHTRTNRYFLQEKSARKEPQQHRSTLSISNRI